MSAGKIDGKTRLLRITQADYWHSIPRGLVSGDHPEA